MHFNFDDLFKQFEDDIFGGEHADHFASHFESHFARHAENVGGDFDFEDIFNAQGFDKFGLGRDSQQEQLQWTPLIMATSGLKWPQ